ncbi:MAG TPA: class I adenylate-forming enzyme family protein [Jatrophihabitantaceae bacterium]|nr:class I adenylate-forming enzyme family protein [Jatrophihabitantaceae bacterium]
MSSSPVAAAAFLAELRTRLTGPGCEFELVDENVRGVRLPVFKNRARSLTEHLERSVAYGEREYLVDGPIRLTFAAHRDAVASLAAELRERGVSPGDRVMILGANSAAWVVSYWALAAVGAVTVAGNVWWTAPETEYAIQHSGSRLVIADARRAPLVPSGVDALSMEHDVPTLMSSRPGEPLAQPDVAEDEPAVIMYTSGTTGRPKGATHSHRNLLSVIEYHRLNDAIVAAMGAPMGTAVGAAPPIPRRFLMTMPLFHIASLHNLALPRLVSGDTVIVDSGRFDVDRVLALIERERVTNWAIVPTMAHRVATHNGIDRYDLSSLVAVSVNSAPSSPALKSRLRAAVPSVQQSIVDSYGLTESSTAATVATPVELEDHPLTVGHPIVTVDVTIRDAHGNAVDDGVDGEVWLRSAFVMLGYWNDPDATARAITPDGWLRTGDLGCMRDGLLFLNTRRSDLILRGGENVYPAEVEAVLGEHPSVSECAVFGVASTDLGQEVAAVVVTSDAVDVDELRTYVAAQLAYYKVPSRWRITAEPLPRTATGKVIRAGLSA